MYPSDPKSCARQIVKESIDRILAGRFDVPTLEGMESILNRNFENLFDEHHAIQSIKASHPSWDKIRRNELCTDLSRWQQGELVLSEAEGNPNRDAIIISVPLF